MPVGQTLISCFEYIIEFFLHSFKKTSWDVFFDIITDQSLTVLQFLLCAWLSQNLLWKGLQWPLAQTWGRNSAWQWQWELLGLALCLWNGSKRPLVHSKSQGCLEFPTHVCLFVKLLQRGVWACSEPDGHGRATACFYLFLCIQEVREQGHSALNSSSECCIIYNMTFPSQKGLFFL